MEISRDRDPIRDKILGKLIETANSLFLFSFARSEETERGVRLMFRSGRTRERLKSEPVTVELLVER